MSKYQKIGYQLAHNIGAQTKVDTSKRMDRIEHGEVKQRKDGTSYVAMGKAKYIHGKTTNKAYVTTCKQFGAWVEEHYDLRAGCKDTDQRTVNKYAMNEAQKHAGEWINQQTNPSTRKAYAAALARGFGCNTADFGVELGTRHYADVTRGRQTGTYSQQTDARTAAWRENHPAEAEALRCCGLRASEARNLRAQDIKIDKQTGRVSVHVINGKGGLSRWARVWETASDHRGADWLRNAANQGKKDFVFRGISGLARANVHALRAEYAARMYDLYKAENVASERLYRPRDGSGVQLDKGIMTAVNHDLGHGDDRCSTLWYNYLSYGGKWQ